MKSANTFLGVKKITHIPMLYICQGKSEKTLSSHLWLALKLCTREQCCQLTGWVWKVCPDPHTESLCRDWEIFLALPKWFHEFNNTMISKPDENVTRKGNYRKTSIINAKILNKVLANQIQEHIKRIIHNDPVECVQGMQGWFDIQK